MKNKTSCPTMPYGFRAVQPDTYRIRTTDRPQQEHTAMKNKNIAAASNNVKGVR